MKARWLLMVSGPDGIGKSTLCNALSKKYGCHYERLIGFHYLSYALLRFQSILLKILHPKSKYIMSMSLLDHPYALCYTKRLVRILYISEVISLYSAILIKILMPSILFKCIIIDEGFINTIANYLEVSARDPAYKDIRKLVIHALRLLNFIKEFFNWHLVLLHLDADLSLTYKRVLMRRRPVTSLEGLRRHKVFIELSENIVRSMFSIRIVYLRVNEI